MTGSMIRIHTPRASYGLLELAALLECRPNALYHHLEPDGPRSWRLKPLDERAYQRWHRRVWRKEKARP